MRPLSLTALPIAVVLTALLTWPAQGAPNKDSVLGGEIASWPTIEQGNAGACGAATKPESLRLAFDETKPPKKVKKRKQQFAPVDPTTGIVEHSQRLRAHGQTTNDAQIKAPKVGLTHPAAKGAPALGGGAPTPTPTPAPAAAPVDICQLKPVLCAQGANQTSKEN